MECFESSPELLLMGKLHDSHEAPFLSLILVRPVANLFSLAFLLHKKPQGVVWVILMYFVCMSLL